MALPRPTLLASFKRSTFEGVIAMAKVLVCSFGGAVVGGLLLFLVTQIGEPAVVYRPVHQAGTAGMQDAINYQPIISKFAVVMGTGFGAIVGAIAGSVGRNRNSSP
jgi:hypothetical protein